jgi:hypothetical protein
MTSDTSCGRTQDCSWKWLFAGISRQPFGPRDWATKGVAPASKTTCRFAGILGDWGDGTRTRDLRVTGRVGLRDAQRRTSRNGHICRHFSPRGASARVVEQNPRSGVWATSGPRDVVNQGSRPSFGSLTPPPPVRWTANGRRRMIVCDGSGLPTGVVTLLFTDVEGSTRLLHELGDGYGEALHVPAPPVLCLRRPPGPRSARDGATAGGAHRCPRGGCSHDPGRARADSTPVCLIHVRKWN